VRRAVTAVLALVWLVSPAAAQAPKKDDPIQAEQRKLRQTEEKLKDEKRKAAEARARETSILVDLEQVEQRLAEKHRDITRLDARITKTLAEVTGLRGEVRSLEQQRGGQEQALARRLRAVYKVHAQGGALPLLLSGDDPVARGRRPPPHPHGGPGRSFDPGVSWDDGSAGGSSAPGRDPAARAGWSQVRRPA
jgi:septal ring factor EnvC (AmiA/AmiB activator)